MTGGFRSLLAFWLGGASGVTVHLSPSFIDVLTVPLEDRGITVAYEDRHFTISQEDRTLTVPAA